jgi:hypothetical protein
VGLRAGGSAWEELKKRKLRTDGKDKKSAKRYSNERRKRSCTGDRKFAWKRNKITENELRSLGRTAAQTALLSENGNENCRDRRGVGRVAKLETELRSLGRTSALAAPLGAKWKEKKRKKTLH